MKAFITLILFTIFISASTAQVVNIEEQRITGTVDTLHWYGHVHGGMALAKVEQQSLQVQGDIKIQFKDDPHQVLLLLDVNLLSAGDEDFTRQAFAHLRYNYKLSRTWSWEAFGQIQTSPIQLLEQRNLIGTGVRWRILKSKDGRQRIYLGTALLWEYNQFTESNGSSTLQRSSNYLSTTFRPGEKIELIQTTYWQPSLKDIHNYRLSTDWQFKIELTKKLAFTIDFEYSIDKNLPPGAPSETYAWSNGISWQL